MRVAVIPVDGPVRIEQPEGDILRYLQAQVSGYVEAIPVSVGYLWVNDRGGTLRPNRVASFLAMQELVGDAVVTGPADAEGETLDLGDEAIEYLRHAVGPLDD